MRSSLGSLLIGSSPDQLGPTSQSTSGIVVPSTKNSTGRRTRDTYESSVSNSANTGLQKRREDAPDARELEKVMFFTPEPVEQRAPTPGKFARMRAAASACFACRSACVFIRAFTDVIAAEPARSERRVLPIIFFSVLQRPGGWSGAHEVLQGKSKGRSSGDPWLYISVLCTMRPEGMHRNSR